VPHPSQSHRDGWDANRKNSKLLLLLLPVILFVIPQRSGGIRFFGMMREKCRIVIINVWQRREGTMTDDQVTNKGKKKWTIIAIVLGVPVYFGVTHFSNSGTGRAAYVCFGVMVLILRAFWRLRQYRWYWATIALVVLAHTLLVVSVPWSSKSIPAPALAPVGILDFILIYQLIWLIEKRMTKCTGASSAI
jgi:hypothetical protein